MHNLEHCIVSNVFRSCYLDQACAIWNKLVANILRGRGQAFKLKSRWMTKKLEFDLSKFDLGKFDMEVEVEKDKETGGGV